MIKKIFIVVFLLLFLVKEGFSQVNAVAESRYKNGKELFKRKQYKLAMEDFRQVLTRTENNPYMELASFYFSLAAYNSSQKNPALDMLKQMERKYPRWNNIGEVYYWLAKINFEKGNPLDAVEAINKIKRAGIKKDADKMERSFLMQINDTEVLNQLLTKNSYDKIVGEALASAIIHQPITEQDHSMLEFLIQEFSLDKKKYDLNAIFNNVKKEEYNVAVLLPFMNNKYSSSSASLGKSLVLNLYSGIKVAVADLKARGIKINLYAFDTERDSTKTKSFIANGDLDGMDLIIGPLSQSASKIVSDFSYERKINMVNPLSNNSGVIGNNPFSFLFKPCLETLAEQATKFAVKKFKNDKLKIIYGTSKRDSVLAFSYKKAMEADSFKVVGMHKVAVDDSRKIIGHLSVPRRKSDDYGHLFFASENELLMANVINVLENRAVRLPTIGLESWLTSKMGMYAQLERIGIYLLNPSYIDFERESVENFKEFYHKKTNAYPSKYAYNGYALMNFFGQQLHENGVYFQLNFQRTSMIKGEIYNGYNYALGNDNHHVPIVQFEEGALKIVNK